MYYFALSECAELPCFQFVFSSVKILWQLCTRAPLLLPHHSAPHRFGLRSHNFLLVLLTVWHLILWLFRRMGDDRKKRSRSRSRDKKRKDRWFLSCWQFGIGSVGLDVILNQISWKDPPSDVQRNENLFVTWYQRTSNLTYIVLSLLTINTGGPRSRSRERRRSRSKEKVKKTSSKRRSHSWQFLLVLVIASCWCDLNFGKSYKPSRKPSLYWDVPPPGFEHITPMQYKSMQVKNTLLSYTSEIKVFKQKKNSYKILSIVISGGRADTCHDDCGHTTGNKNLVC